MVLHRKVGAWCVGGSADCQLIDRVIELKNDRDLKFDTLWYYIAIGASGT